LGAEVLTGQADGDDTGFSVPVGGSPGCRFAAFQRRKFLGCSGVFDALRADAANPLDVAVGWEQPLKRRLADDRMKQREDAAAKASAGAETRLRRSIETGAMFWAI